MAFVIWETHDSRSARLAFDSQSATLEFVGGVTLNDTTARLGFLSILPLVWNGLLFKEIQIDPLGGGVWKGTAQYESFVIESQAAGAANATPPPPPPAPAANEALGPEYSWDISGQTEHITRSLKTVESKGVQPNGDAETPRNFNRAIGYVEKTGEVQGCDIISPKCEFSVTKLWPFISINYLKTVASLIGSVNLLPFYNFEAGEVLFLGQSGQPRDNSGKVAITYKFGVSLNRTNVEISQHITLANKRGWEYVWVSFGEKEDAVTKKRIAYPKAVYVEEVYPKKDFALLGIG